MHDGLLQPRAVITRSQHFILRAAFKILYQRRSTFEVKLFSRKTRVVLFFFLTPPVNAAQFGSR